MKVFRRLLPSQEITVPHSGCGTFVGVEVVAIVWRLDRCTHIFMVLLEVDQLLSQCLDFTLQVETAQICVVNDLPQTHNISLHRLPDGQLRLVPGRENGGRRDTARQKGR